MGPPLDPAPENLSRDEAIKYLTVRMNEVYEKMIRANPGQCSGSTEGSGKLLRIRRQRRADRAASIDKTASTSSDIGAAVLFFCAEFLNLHLQ